MTDLPRQAIVGDIGHTNIRFALADIDELTITNFGYMSTAMFSGPGEALRAYLRSIPERPPIVSIAVAGPVRGNAAGISQLDWSFTADEIRSVIDARVCLTNGFEALAMLLPHLDAHDIHRIGGGGEVRADAPRVVLGPGTTMEAAAFIPTADGACAIASRAGAICFAGRDPAELALLSEMRPDLRFIAVDDVLSSRGLGELERVLGRRAPTDRCSAAEIVKAAHVHHEPAAEEAMRRFATWLGGFAGDMGLLYGAGGVYLAGGMAPAMLETLSAGPFRSAFEAKGAASAFLKEMPVHVITAPDACLRGAALAAAHMSGTRERNSFRPGSGASFAAPFIPE